MNRPWTSRLIAGAALVWVVAGTVRGAGQVSQTFVGTLDEHPAIQYAERPVTDRVARLNQALDRGAASLARDARTGYLVAVLRALDVAPESQLLVFSKTGLQRDHTGPHNPRALFFNEAVAVGYIPGAPSLELAAHDPQQGVVFYTLDQPGDGPPRFTRRTNCLTCHISTATLEVPGMIVRSNMVGADGQVMPRLGSHTVNHQTPHTERWGGWFVTGHSSMPPYGPLGHLGNVTVTPHPTSGPAIISNHVLIEWLNRPSDADRYLASDSDLAALMTFDHQMHGLNLLTRLNWDARIAVAESRPLATDPALQRRADELADYLLFVGEAPLAFEVTPRPGFAEALLARTPKDRRGRSLAEMDLTERLLKYSCSYLVYSDAFQGLPVDVRHAVFRRMFDGLTGAARRTRYPHLSASDRVAIAEILRDTVADLPADIAPATPQGARR